MNPIPMYFIYTLTCPIDGVVKYIGVTNDFRRRYDNHINDREGEKGKWIKALKKRKLLPTIKVIDMVPEPDKFYFEKKYIDLYKEAGFILFNKPTGVPKRDKSILESTPVKKRNISDTSKFYTFVKENKGKFKEY